MCAPLAVCAMAERMLEDVTVIDVSTYITGGFATMMFANQGATVIKVEQPGSGDPARNAPPFVDGESGYFMTCNYGKQSVELDLKSEEGLEVLYDLVGEADVFVQNFRPGVASRLGIDAESLRPHREDLIYCSITAFGESNEWSDRAGFDLLLQGMTGIMSVTGEDDGSPVKVGVPITDLITASWVSFGVMNALYRRSKTGEGEFLKLSMYDAVMPWLSKQAAKVFEDEEPTPMGTKDPAIAPYQAYETRDGHILVGIASDKLWHEFCEVIDRLDLADDDRFATNSDRVDNRDALTAELEATLTERTADEWETILVDEYGLPVGQVRSIPEALYNDVAEERGILGVEEHQTMGSYPVVEHPLRFENADSGFDRHAPSLGADTVPVLESLGYDRETIDTLLENEVVGTGNAAQEDA